jgi:hypothetical protein
LEYYAQDAIILIGYDYANFGSYIITPTIGFDTVPSELDSMLISLKGAALANLALVQESIADAIMVRAGSISLDTTKALGAKGREANRLEAIYDKIINNLLLDVTGASNVGYRVDNYISYINEQINSKSLL